MRIKSLWPFPFVIIPILFISGCGQSYPDMVFAKIPAEEYARLAGVKALQRVESGFYRRMVMEDFTSERKPEEVIEEVKTSGGCLNQIGFFLDNSEAGLTYPNGPFLIDQWIVISPMPQPDAELIFSNPSPESEQNGAVEVGDGVLSGHAEAIESLSAVSGGKKKNLLEDENFRRARGLVDFNSTEFYLQWGDKGKMSQAWGPICESICGSAGGSSQDVGSGIIAYGLSVYWGDDLQSVTKILFDEREKADSFYQAVVQNKVRAFFSLQTFLFSPYVALYSRNVVASKLSEKIVTSINDSTVEIRFSVTYDEIENARSQIRFNMGFHSSVR